MTQRSIVQFDDSQLTIIRRTVAKDTTAEEFALFIEVCKYHALNPFARQIYAVVRTGNSGRQMSIQTSIDGYRLLAERSGKYAGQIGPHWCGKDGEWKDVWLEDAPPVAARIGVLRKDFDQPVWGVAKYKSYQSVGPLWSKMPDVLLAKCAESLALRKAFPAEMSGIYTKEEMQQAGDEGEELPAHVTEAKTVDATVMRPQQEELPPVAPTKKPVPEAATNPPDGMPVAPTPIVDATTTPTIPHVSAAQMNAIRNLNGKLGKEVDAKYIEHLATLSAEQVRGHITYLSNKVNELRKQSA